MNSQETKSILSEQATKLTAQAWILHQKLTGAYKHSTEQLEDMIKMGELATAIMAIRKAMSLI